MVLVGRKEIHFSGKYARQGNRNHFSNQSSRIASQNENNTIVPETKLMKVIFLSSHSVAATLKVAISSNLLKILKMHWIFANGP